MKNALQAIAAVVDDPPKAPMKSAALNHADIVSIINSTNHPIAVSVA